jgi:hypothetical protein
MKLPCELSCPKCGSSDIYRNFYKAKEKIRSIVCVVHGFDWDFENPFIELDLIAIKAKKDIILHHCRCCQYEFATDPLPDPIDVKNLMTFVSYPSCVEDDVMTQLKKENRNEMVEEDSL